MSMIHSQTIEHFSPIWFGLCRVVHIFGVILTKINSKIKLVLQKNFSTELKVKDRTVVIWILSMVYTCLTWRVDYSMDIIHGSYVNTLFRWSGSSKSWRWRTPGSLPGRSGTACCRRESAINTTCPVFLQYPGITSNQVQSEGIWNVRERQPAFTYGSHTVDTSVLCILE